MPCSAHYLLGIPSFVTGFKCCSVETWAADLMSGACALSSWSYSRGWRRETREAELHAQDQPAKGKHHIESLRLCRARPAHIGSFIESTPDNQPSLGCVSFLELAICVGVFQIRNHREATHFGSTSREASPQVPKASPWRFGVACSLCFCLVGGQVGWKARGPESKKLSWDAGSRQNLFCL